MSRASIIVAGIVFIFCISLARAYQSDNGNGTFNNPVMYADYPDPTICRAGSDFYMVSTTFADSPGMTVLHSKDLVNWKIASHCATNLDWSTSYNTMGAVACGSRKRGFHFFTSRYSG